MEEKTYYFSIARFFMELTTIWYPAKMTETSRKMFKILAYFVKGNFHLFVALLGFGLITTDSEADRHLYWQYFFSMVGILIRVWFLHTKKIKAIYSDIYHVEKIIASEINKNLRNIFFDEVKYNKNLAKLIIVMSMFANAQFVLISLYLWLNLKDVFFSVFWYPFDKNQYINIAALHQILSMVYTVVTLLALNITVVPLMLFATTRLKLLCYKFQHLKQLAENMNLRPKDYLKLLVKEHLDIISYVVSVNDSFRWSFLVDFLLKSYEFTQFFYGVIIAFSDNRMRLAINLFAFVVILVEIWYACYHGNELILESQELSKCIYANNNWYELDKGLQKDLQIIMLRSQRPLCISVGNLHDIDNNLFLTIMKAGYTFIIFYKV